MGHVVSTYEPNWDYGGSFDGKRKDLAATKIEAQLNESLGGWVMFWKIDFAPTPPYFNAQVKVEILWVSHSERWSVHITQNFIERKDICATI